MDLLLKTGRGGPKLRIFDRPHLCMPPQAKAKAKAALTPSLHAAVAVLFPLFLSPFLFHSFLAFPTLAC